MNLGQTTLAAVADLGGEYLSLKIELDHAIERVMLSGQYVLGREVVRLEETISKMVGVRFAVGVNSGTDAIMIALKAIGIEKDDEVITSPFTFFATAEAIIHAEARPVFADIDLDTLTLNPKNLEGLIHPQTKVILPVHIYGQTAEMSRILTTAKNKGLQVVEDMAQALGATYEDKDAGEFGRAAALSFYPTKNLGACGDAGMILTNDEKVASFARRLRSHGAAVKYQHEQIGYNSRLDELQAAILNVKLQHFTEWTKKRIELAHLYDELLKNVPVIKPYARKNGQHVYHLYSIRTPRRDDLQKTLLSKGIETGIHYPVPLHQLPALKFLGYKKGDFPNAERVSQETLSLPLNSQTTSDQIEMVSKAIQAFFA